MSDIGHLYDGRKVNIVFAASSVLLLLVTTWMIADDAKREWKDWQIKYNAMEVEVAWSRFEREEQTASEGGWSALDEKVKKAEAEVAGRAGDLAAIEAERTAKQGELDRLVAQVTELAGEADAVRSTEELAARHEHRQPNPKVLDGINAALEKLKIAQQAKESELKTLKDRADTLLAGAKAANEELDKLLAKRDRLDKKLDSIEPGLINTIRNMPLMDFLDPSLKIQQILPPNLFLTHSFAQTPIVDRCMSCHISATKADYMVDSATGKFTDPDIEEYMQAQTGGDPAKVRQWKSVFGAHPRLDLFVGSTSPHPVDRFGCVTCHGGNGLATSFNWAGHIPHNEAVGEDWAELNGWKFPHYEEFPMYMRGQTQASCKKCHVETLHVREAHDLNRGLTLIQRMGCYACHKMDNFANEGLPKPGPSLVTLKDKLSPEWVARWVTNPHAIRPATPMPRIFGVGAVSENDKQDVEAREAADIKGIVHYLFKHSETRPMLPPAPSGNAEKGKALFKTAGCIACHEIGVTREERDPAARNAFGPPLDGIGAKAEKSWIRQWILNPRSLRPEARMPDMRVTDQEATDLAEYLSTLTTPDPTKTAVAEVSEDVLRKVAKEHLEEKMMTVEAEAAVKEMNEDALLSLIGDRAIYRQGCYSCHDIRGFREEKYRDMNANGRWDAGEPFTDENANEKWDPAPLPIGADISDWARKNLHQIDFGLLHLDHTRAAFLKTKFANPRVFDEGRIVTYKNRLKMPKFEFRPQDIRDLVTAVLSFTREKLPVTRLRTLDHQEEVAERGRRIIRERNCQACHLVDHDGGELLAAQLEPGMAPPSLVGEGRRVRPDWLFPFLKNPTTIRPWLSIRMPNFGFDDAEANIVTEHFVATSRLEKLFISGDDIPAPHPAMLASGKQLFDKAQCLNCHFTGATPPPGKDAASLAPNLSLAAKRLNYFWVADWIEDPNTLMPGTKMPGFFARDEEGKLAPLDKDALGGDAKAQIDALRVYVMSLGKN